MITKQIGMGLKSTLKVASLF